MSLKMNHNFMKDKVRELRMNSTEAEKLMWNSLKDKLRDEYLKSIGYKIIRLWNNEVLNNIDGCLDLILAKLQEKI